MENFIRSGLLLPSVVLASVVLILAWYVRSSFQQRLELPLVKVVNNDWKDALLQATKQYPDQPFLFPTVPPRIILPNHVIDEIRSLPEDQVSLRKEVYDKMHGKYTDMGKDHPVGIAAIKTDLTNNVGRMLPEIQEEAIYALGKEFGNIPKWTNVFVYTKLLRLAVLTNGRMFVGLPLSRTEEWIGLSIIYTTNVIQGISAVQRVNPLLRPFKAPFLPEIKSLAVYKKRGTKLLTPYIQDILDARNSSVGAKEPAKNQYNLISWMLNQVDTKRKVDFELLANEQLFATFGSIFATCIIVTNALFDIAAHPECVAELRKEIEEVLGSEPGHILKKENLPKFRKMDSFLRESQRMSPNSLTSLHRRVTSKSGLKLSTGHTIPQNVAIGFVHPFSPFVRPPTKLKTPLDHVPSQPPLDTFYAFRHSEIRSIPGQENAHQFTQTGQDNINFGHGRMACPGRFFGGAQIKCILIEIIRRYDVSLGPDGEGENGPNGLKRPQNIVMPGSLQYLPDFSKSIYMKSV